MSPSADVEGHGVSFISLKQRTNWIEPKRRVSCGMPRTSNTFAPTRADEWAMKPPGVTLYDLGVA